MRLIEKKCPNCGASLEFKENDKSCTCEYCKRAFEIEREEKDTKDISEQYKLKKLSTVQKAAFAYIFGSYFVICLIPFLIIAGVTIAMIFGITKTNSLITDVSNLTDSSFDKFDTQALFKIKGANGNTSHHYFSVDERVREKIYVAYKKGSNYIIAVYKVKYKDMFHEYDIQTIYVPLVYENVKSGFVSLHNEKIDAPEYYFDEEKTTYAYGYANLDELYENVIKPLEKEYTITEK